MIWLPLDFSFYIYTIGLYLRIHYIYSVYVNFTKKLLFSEICKSVSRYSTDTCVCNTLVAFMYVLEDGVGEPTFRIDLDDLARRKREVSEPNNNNITIARSR